jgi:hypothetical protein
VSRCLDEADPREELRVAVDGLEGQVLVVGLEVGAVERAVEAEGPLLLLGAADQPGVRLGEQLDVPGVVEVQVGQDHVVDVAGGDAELLEAGVEVLLLGDLVVGEEVLQAGRGPVLLPVPRAAGIPQQPAVGGIHQHAVRRHVDPLGRQVLVVPVADRPVGCEQEPGEIGGHRSARKDADSRTCGHRDLRGL